MTPQRDQSITLPPWAQRRGLSVDAYLRKLAGGREWKRRNREANLARDRARHADPAHRGKCEVCGGLMGIGTQNDGICASCVRAGVHLRRMVLVDLWAAGAQFPEIMEVLGVSKNYLAAEMSRAREAGYGLPYRYGPERRAGS